MHPSHIWLAEQIHASRAPQISRSLPLVCRFGWVNARSLDKPGSLLGSCWRTVRERTPGRCSDCFFPHRREARAESGVSWRSVLREAQTRTCTAPQGKEEIPSRQEQESLLALPPHPTPPPAPRWLRHRPLWWGRNQPSNLSALAGFPARTDRAMDHHNSGAE